MNRYRLRSTLGYGIGYESGKPGYKKVFIIHWRGIEYAWEFGKGDSYDWDGYEKL